METALTIAATGILSAAVMKQVGLNVAADPLMSGAYIGVDGGMVVISADDPGLYSSQTEQDSKIFAMMAKIPVFDPARPEKSTGIILRRPRLCPGYHHRSSFYALKMTLKNGIHTGDIGCYTLGLNLKALDTCVCMGASITQASAMYQAFANWSTAPPSPRLLATQPFAIREFQP